MRFCMRRMHARVLHQPLLSVLLAIVIAIATTTATTATTATTIAITATTDFCYPLGRCQGAEG